MSSDSRPAISCDSSGDIIKCVVADSTDTDSTGQFSAGVSDPCDDPNNATHVTIQLPSDMQGSILSQQKLQELIVQLSQSGQIQLREDSKIVIELKFADKTDEPPSVKPLKNQTSSAPGVLRTPATAVTALRAAQPDVKPAIQSKSESTAPATVIARPQATQQQPTYFIVSAGQLSNATDGQLYSGSGQLRANAGGSVILRTLGGATVAAGNSSALNNQDRSIIIVPQPITAGTITANANPSAVINANGTATLVPLRHLTSGNVGRVASNTTWVSATSARFVGAGAASALYVNSSTVNVGSRANQNSYLSAAVPSGCSSTRESSWQQYVKQFNKLGPCPICGDKISGYHYGIFCCESCKGFFKRTVQNGKRYACHHPSGSAVCDINVGSRKKCPACRFIKCVEKGMRIEAIRSDRTRGGRSMYPGSRYLRQIAARVGGNRSGTLSSDLSTEQPTGDLLLSAQEDPDQLSCSIVGLPGVHHNLGPDGLPSSVDAGGGVYLDPAILGNQGDDDDDDADQAQLHMDQSLVDYPGLNASCGTPFVGRQVIVSGSTEAAGRTRIELPKVITEILSVEESVEAEPEDILEIDTNNVPPGTSIPDGVSEDEAAVYRALLNLADQRLYRTVRWSRALPDFAQLDTDDQILLLQNCWADLLCLDCCWRSLPTPTEIRLTSSKCINLEAARELGAEEIVERMLQLTQYLTQLELDLVEYACLKVIVLMQPDLKNLKAADHVRQYQATVQRVLADYVLKSSPTKRDKYSKLMSRIPELQVTSHTARLILVDLDLSPYLSNNSLLMELLRSDIQRYTPTGPSTLSGDALTEGRVSEPVDPAAKGDLLECTKNDSLTMVSRESQEPSSALYADGTLTDHVGVVASSTS